MKRVFNYLIDTNQSNTTIIDYLTDLGYGSSLLKRLKHTDNSVQVNEQPVLLKHILKEGEELKITIDEEGSDNIVPTNIPIDIIYEDEDILVVNKGANLPVHPSMDHYTDTLGNAVAYYYESKKESIVYRALTRLDRDTSGLVLIAKNIYAAGLLSKLISNNEIKKTYYAEVTGHMEDISGTINAPIARKEGSIIERCVDFDNGQVAVTHFNTLKYFDEYDVSLLEITLDTGRTHQIRVHMKHINHPLIGDFLYNPDYKYINRQALHCARMSFIHPIKKEPLNLEAPYPSDFIK
ncbi:MAG: RluA family pseudouridine synthase [Lachnospiraceae bacterium]|nr:RluA family pseudouridine synthase [Lachnospiraceae bacterium]